MGLLKRLWECLTVWSVTPTSLQGAQAILSHAAGENTPSDPGVVNEYNAELIRKLYQELKVPVIAQGELKLCLSGIPGVIFSPRQAETAPNYMNTYDIAIWHKAEDCASQEFAEPPKRRFWDLGPSLLAYRSEFAATTRRRRETL